MTIDCLTSRASSKPRSAIPARRFIVAALVMGLPLPSYGQTPAVTRGDIVRAEDARGNGLEGIKAILAGLRQPSLRETAVRALGRLEQPELSRHIVPFLADSVVRATAADALAQAMRGLPAPDRRSPEQRSLLDSVFQLLARHALHEPDGSTRAAIARSIGRLPFSDSRQARAAESTLVALAPHRTARLPLASMEGVGQGLYSLARARRAVGDLSPAAIAWLQHAARVPGGSNSAAVVRRSAWLALTAAGGVSRDMYDRSEPDAQVRRLAVAALPNVADSAFRWSQLQLFERDLEPIVRLEWVRVYRLVAAAANCRPLLEALSDSVAHVQLAAIDALGGPCPERDSVVATLRGIIDSGPSGVTPRPAGKVSWHARAHALTALARVDAPVAAELLRRDSRHAVWQVRMYVARGAAAVRDSALLTSLAFDSIGSVREVAIQGLSATVGHLADLVYVRALSSPDYHVSLAAARALKGAPVRDSVLPAVLAALERISSERRQTSRDPRLELLARVREMGDARVAARLRPLLADVDDEVREAAASLITQFTGQSVWLPVAESGNPSGEPARGTLVYRVTMAAASGGGTFDIALDADRAPMSVTRLRNLIRRRYYDGLTFHRVVPNFVLQGGSPGMNEYVGDGPFMRDELSLAHHDRYTLGISTRGRDTGDAQWFINLVDNYRLDHDYTVIGRITRGFDVVDRILEGDVMESVRIVPE